LSRALRIYCSITRRAELDTVNFPFGQVGAEEIPLLRKASEDTRPGFPSILRVIVCPRSVNGGRARRSGTSPSAA